MTLVPHNLPDYVELGGRQVWRAPYTAREAQVFGFVVKADRAKIDAQIKKALVAPTGELLDYRCAHDHIVVTFAKIDRLASGDAVDGPLGYMAEREAAIWCLAADMRAGGRLVWYLPYVFTEPGQTVATGREVYGYPKQMGLFHDDFPDLLESGGETVVGATAIKTYGPDSKAEPLVVISVQSVAAQSVVADSAAAGFTFFAEFNTAFSGGQFEVSTEVASSPAPEPELVITTAGAPRPVPKPPPPPWARRRRLVAHSDDGIGLGLWDGLIQKMIEMPTLVYLKQFRDVQCTTKACYQAVVESGLSVDPSGADYRALSPEQFKINFANCDSHPIRADLGIASPALTPERAFKARFNFDIMLGQEVWRAPT